MYHPSKQDGGGTGWDATSFPADASGPARVKAYDADAIPKAKITFFIIAGLVTGFAEAGQRQKGIRSYAQTIVATALWRAVTQNALDRSKALVFKVAFAFE
jgi:hypothetical protein